MSFRKAMKLVVGAILISGLATAAQATTVIPVNATANSSYPGYPAGDAIDQGTNKLLTDWAAGSTGAGSYLDLDLGQSYNLATAYVTDRVTSGGGNGGFVGGLFDFTTKYELQAYTDSTFTTTTGSAFVFDVSLPSSTSSAADFLTVHNVSGLSGQYIRYTVLSAQGVNPGLANIEFTAVPEPSIWVMFLVGFGALGLMMRSSRRTQLGAFAAI